VERLARSRLKLSAFGVLCLVAWAILIGTPALAFRAVSFNLSTNRTFSPEEKPSIHLYTHDVDELEFRVYRVSDPEKFLTNLRDLHSLSSGTPWGPKERIDERTWLERFHDWKHHLWYVVRRFFRGQFSVETRNYFRAKQSSLARRSRIVGVAHFAQIPLLNDKQLVARWRQETPPTYISDSQDLPIDPLPAGLYLVEATDGHYKAYTLLIVSRVVLITRTNNGTVLAFVVNRQTGTPVSNAQVKLGIGARELASGQTGADGTAELHATVTPAQQDNLWVMANQGTEFAAVTPGAWSFSNNSGNRWASYVYTDRPVYRPGHAVHWKAILRTRVENHLELPKASSIHAVISDEQDHPVYEKDLRLTTDGTVAGDFLLGAHAALGYYSIRLGGADDGINGGFHVEEYRKPEYQVRVTAQQPRVIEGQGMQVVIDSRYFFGEPVAFGKVKYRVYHSTHYWWDEEPQDNEGMGAGEDAGGSGDTSLYDANQQSEQTAQLDANGKLTITVPTTQDRSAQHSDLDYTVEAGVKDEANREITGRGRFLATYGTYRIHVEPVSYAVRAGESAAFNVNAVDYDGKPVSAKVHLQLTYRRWSSGKSVTTRGPSTDATTDAQGNARATIAVADSGSAEVMASSISTLSSGENREIRDSTWLWIFGGNQADFFGGGAGQVQIIADKKTYQPGDTAHLGIVSAVDDFHALVIATGYSIEFRKVLSSTGKTLNFDLPITGDSQPNLDVTVVFLKDNQLYQASRQLKVPPLTKQLQIEIAPAKQIFQPGQSASYDVYTRDSSGNPVSAEFSFGVVDEAIYSIYPDTSGDIVKTLYPNRFSYASIDSSIEYYFSGSAGLKSPLLAERASRYRPQLAQVKPGTDLVQPKIRKAFPDTAYWSPDEHTDRQGHAHVTLTFPDSLTTWRTTVRAITPDSKAGSGIDRIIVRKNIIVRMGTPRFLRKGDELAIPVIVHNYLDQPKQVQVSLEIHGLDTLTGAPQQINVASKADGTLYWRVRATRIGTATLLAKALTNEESDALEISLPVEPVGVPQKINSTGVLTASPAQKVVNISFPGTTDAAAHSIHVEVSPSIAGGLFSALDYLTSYPYGCTEQTMSSFLPNVIVAETLKKLNLSARIDLNDLAAKVNAGFDRLSDYQHDDGGWGWWKEDQSRVFMTAYVVGGLAEAARSYPLNSERQQMMDRGRRYLEKQLAGHPRMIPDLRAYVVYALSEAQTEAKTEAKTEAGGLSLGSQLDTLWSRRNDLSSEGLALVGLAMLRNSDTRAGETAKLLEGKAKQTGEIAYWPSNFSPLLDFEYDNSAESTAFAMRFLAHADPESKLLPQAAQWLMLNRDGGYWWVSTEQTAMVIFGMVDYLAGSQELNADFDADILVNGTNAGHRHFTPDEAASGAVLEVEIPSSKLQTQDNTIEVVKKGSGRAYWTVQGTYSSTDHKLYQKGTLSLNITRDYFRLIPTQDKSGIVYRLDALRGPVQPGDVLAVHLAVNGSPAKYLLIEDPIPAGTEFIQHEDSYNIIDSPTRWTYWYTRREFHDDRAAIFATEFGGRDESFYLLKVVNPGSFSISPASVEPMYQPGTQATSDLLHLDVNNPAGQENPREGPGEDKK
jgi:hypothetical protein